MPGNKASSMQRHEQFQAKQYRKNYRETTYNFTNHGITPSRGLAVLSLLCLAGMAVGPVMVRAQPSASLGPVLTLKLKVAVHNVRIICKSNRRRSTSSNFRF